MTKYRYVESAPDSIKQDFESYEAYHAFYLQRFDEVSKKIDLFTNYGAWKHGCITLNKDGLPRKYNAAKHLQTKESRQKQEIKFREYLDKKQAAAAARREQNIALDEKACSDAIKILLKNKIDLNRLDIRIKKRY